MRKTPGLLAALAVVLGARADIVYDNTTTYQGMFLASTNEYGDEISLAGTARLATAFLFEYFGDFTPEGDEMVRFRMYANDGPIYYKEYREPGSVLYDTGFMPIGTNVNTVKLFMARLQVPNTFTYTVQFVGLRQVPGDRAGLMFYDPPTVGAELPPFEGKTIIGSYPDFWEKAGGRWDLYGYASPHPPANFGAQVLAIIPEPSTVALGALAAAGWLGCRAARRRWQDGG
jgi:hypothetical protein